jgi:hypothetical protein
MTAPGTHGHDATGRSAAIKKDRFAFNRPPADEPWIWLPRSMLESAAWSAMSLAARKAVDRIIIEHLAHAGGMNGELAVTYDDFVAFGIRRSSIRNAIALAVALGFVDVTTRGARSYGVRRLPSQYGLTWMGRRDRTPPSNRWRGVDPAHAQAVLAGKRSDAGVSKTNTSRRPALQPRYRRRSQCWYWTRSADFRHRWSPYRDRQSRENATRER